MQSDYDRLKVENEALRAELEQRKAFFRDMTIGVWTVEKIEGRPPRMWGDAVMDEMVGVVGRKLTPEEYFNAWFGGIYEEDRNRVVEAVAEMDSGKRLEVQYRIHHPTRGEVWIRCGARRDFSFTKGVRQVGRHQDVTELVHEEEQLREILAALGQEYRTIWIIGKATEQMRLLRETEESRKLDNVGKALETRDYSAMHAWHVKECVLAEDRDRVWQAARFETVLEALKRQPLYTVNYRRQHGERIVHHQMAFADAGRSVVLAFRGIQSTVEQELAAERKAEELVMARRLAEIGQDRADKEHRLNESLEVLVQETDLDRALERIMSIWCDALGAQWCNLGKFEGDYYTVVHYYATDGERPILPVGVKYPRLRKEFDEKYIRAPDGDFLAFQDCQENPYMQGLVRLSPNPDSARAVASSYIHLIRIDGKVWGTLGLKYRRRHELTENEERFFRASAKVVQLALISHAFRERLERERDRALAAERSKSLFFSSVSHDIRTPLNAILGFAELLEQGVADAAEHDRYVSTIRSSGRVLARLVNDILDLSKLESGRLELIPEPTDVPAVAREVAESFDIARSQKSVIFATDIAEMPLIEIDPQRVRQLLYNLLSNAFKYTDRGRITLRTGWANGALTLSVADTGRGISRADIARVLQPFVQLADRNHRDGTGLGLSICQRLAKLMGGELSIASEVGKGSVFTITLPKVTLAAAARASRAAGTAARKAPARKVRPGGKMSRVLVVDDSNVNRAVLKAMLVRNGAREVVTAEDGKKALALLAKDNRFDAVLTDLWMPELDGEGLLKAIRADQRLASLPVYLISADVEAVKDPSSGGFTGILLKPITNEGVRALMGG